MLKSKAAVVAGLMMGMACGAWAGSFGIAPHASTLGFGADAVIGIGEQVSIRGGFNMAQFSENIDLDEASTDGKFKWGSYPILLDWHPAGGGFRISAGVLLNNNEVTMSVLEGETLELDGVEFTLDSLEGDITFAETCPYFGIGYGAPANPEGNLHFFCDFGVMYQGEPEVQATAVASDPRAQSALDAALQVEVEKLQDDLSFFYLYPVIAVGFCVTF